LRTVGGIMLAAASTFKINETRHAKSLAGWQRIKTRPLVWSHPEDK
jgi:hypothetical protein